MRLGLAIAFLCSIFVCINSCRHGQACSHRFTDLNQVQYTAEGCMRDSMEIGLWVLKDSSGNLIQKGNYDVGVRTGDWQYPGQSPAVITWTAVSASNIAVKTNLPTNLKVLEEGEDFIKYERQDSARSFFVIISVRNTDETVEGVAGYYKSAEAEVLKRGWAITSSRAQLITESGRYYVNSYEIDTLDDDGFRTLNMYTVNNAKFIEVSCQYVGKDELFARQVFFSIFSNLFVNDKRVIHPLDNFSVLANPRH